MKKKLEELGRALIVALAFVSGISTPALALDAAELMSPDEVEFEASVMDAGFSSVAEYNAYMRDPRDRNRGPGRGDRDRNPGRDRDRNPDRDRGDRGRDDRGRDRGPGRDRPDTRPTPPRRPNPPLPPRRPAPPRRAQWSYECVARNQRGMNFFAYDRFDARFAQREAMRQCYRHSRVCYEMGCRQIRR